MLFSKEMTIFAAKIQIMDNIRNWTKLVPGDIIYVGVPQKDGSYSGQTSEIIQSKVSPYGSGEYWYLRFKVTGSDEKRERKQFVIHTDHDLLQALYEGRIGSILTEEPRYGKLVAALSEEALAVAVNIVIDDEIEKCERDIFLINDKIDTLKKQRL